MTCFEKFQFLLFLSNYEFVGSKIWSNHRILQKETWRCGRCQEAAQASRREKYYLGSNKYGLRGGRKKDWKLETTGWYLIMICSYWDGAPSLQLSPKFMFRNINTYNVHVIDRLMYTSVKYRNCILNLKLKIIEQINQILKRSDY